MELTSVTQSLSPIISRSEITTDNHLVGSYNDELSNLIAATMLTPSSATLGNRVDVKA